MTQRDYLNLKRRIEKNFSGPQQDIILDLLERQKATDKAFKIQAIFNNGCIETTKQTTILADNVGKVITCLTNLLDALGLSREDILKGLENARKGEKESEPLSSDAREERSGDEVDAENN